MSGRTLLALLLVPVLAFAGCGAPPAASPPGSFADATVDPFPNVGVNPRSDLDFPDYPEVPAELAPATRVLSREEVATLTHWEVLNADACGNKAPDRPKCEYAFAFSTLPAGVAVGSVIAGEKSATAPKGVLAVVTSLEGASGRAVEGSLADALVNGSYYLKKEFTASDARPKGQPRPGVVRTFAATTGTPDEGVPLAAVTPTEPGSAAPLKTVGKEFGFELDIHEKGVNATGNVSLGAKCEFGAGIVTKWLVVPKGVWFDAGCGVSQSAAIDITYGLEGPIGEPIELDTIDLGDMTVFIGPLPVYIEFELVVSLAPTGQLLTELNFGASESVEAAASIHYRTGKGWWTEKKFEKHSEWHATPITTEGTTGAELRLDFRAMIYTVAGPYISVGLGLDIDTKWGRKPASCLYLSGRLGVGAHLDLKMFGTYDYGPKNLLSERWEIGCHGNLPPTVTITKPTSGEAFYAGDTLLPQLVASASDPEDGARDVTWSSSLDGEIGTRHSGEPLVWRPRTPGTHVLTARATDPEGQEAQASVTVIAKAPPWSLELELADSPGDPPAEVAAKQGGEVLVHAKLTSPELTPPPCSAVTWATTPQVPVTDLGNCIARVKLDRQGLVTLTATAKGQQGQLASDRLGFRVGPPDAAPAYEIMAKLPDGRVVTSGSYIVSSPVTVSMRWTNPDARTPTYAWTVTTNGGPAEPLGGTWTADGATSTRTFTFKPDYYDRTFVIACDVRLDGAQATRRQITLKVSMLPK